MLKEPTKERLYSLYYKENKSLEEIGKIFNKCRWSIKQRMIKSGIPIKRRGGIKRDIISRFVHYIKITGSCWEWIGGKARMGYGAFRFNGKVTPAHRVSYILYRGEIPDSIFVCHICDNPSCVNPNHLYLGTQKDNMDDARNKNRNAKGEKHGNSKLTIKDVKEIKQLIKKGNPLSKIGKRFNVGYQAVYKIKTGRTWKHIT